MLRIGSIQKILCLLVVSITLALQSCQAAPVHETKNLKTPAPENSKASETASVTQPVSLEAKPAQNSDISQAVPTTVVVPLTDTPELAVTSGSVQDSSVSFGGVTFIVPHGIAKGVSSELVPARDSWGDLPYFDYYASHLLFKLDGYVIANHFFEARIEVYPVEIVRRYSKVISDRMDQVENTVTTGNLEQSELPFLPMINAVQVIHPKSAPLDFQNGKGYRFLAVYSQAVNPVANNDLFFAYQGLTADGKYLVTALLPVNAPILPSDSNTVDVPEGGIPFIDTKNFDPGSVRPYLDRVSLTLEALEPGDFTPSLAELDGMLNSLNIENPDWLYPACPALLQINTRAYVSLDPPTRNRLRADPNTGSEIIGEIDPGTVVEILSGPVCSNSLIYWNVRVPSLDQSGWTAESDFEEQWLLPCPAEGNCPPDWVK